MREGPVVKDSITGKNLHGLSSDEKVLYDRRFHEKAAVHCKTCLTHTAASV